KNTRFSWSGFVRGARRDDLMLGFGAEALANGKHPLKRLPTPYSTSRKRPKSTMSPFAAPFAALSLIECFLRLCLDSPAAMESLGSEFETKSPCAILL